MFRPHSLLRLSSRAAAHLSVVGGAGSARVAMPIRWYSPARN